MQQIGNTGDAMAVLPLLWVFVLMAAVVLAMAGNRMNRRMTKRIGMELEIIKQAHARDAPNQKLATWLDLKAQEWVTSKANRPGVIKRLMTRWRGYTHDVVDYTKIVSDSSLSRGGVEVVSPPLVDDDVDDWINQLSFGLRGVANVDNTCGFHLHVGLRGHTDQWETNDIGQFSVNMENYYKAKAILGGVLLSVGYFQKVYNLMVSGSRRNGRWSRNVSHIWDKSFVREWFADYQQGASERMKVNFLNKVADYFINNGDRYYCVNSQAFNRYGTIEFRSHQGTTNARKIRNWADMHYLIVARCSSTDWMSTIEDYNPKSIHDFFGFLGLAPGDHLVKHQIRRIRKLNSDRLSDIFAHDPQLALSQVFETGDLCTGCGSRNCDHDGECRQSVDNKTKHEVKRHFSWHESCDNCGHPLQDIIDNGGSIDYNDMNAYCPNCDDYHYFSAYTGLILSLLLGVGPLVLLIVGCGIGAIHVGSRRKFSQRNLAAKLFRGLAVRGKQAAGFAFTKRDDNGKRKVYYLKQAQPSTAMAHRIRKEINVAETSWIMQHTRFATHGVNNDKNAHPHFGRKAKVTLVHNGVVHNHNSVWKALGETPTGPVDSQAVAQCLEVGGIETVVKHCKGSMSLIWNDIRDGADVLKCWTNGGNPLVMGRIDDKANGPVVIASTEAILKQACGNRLKTHWDATIGREYTIQADGTISKRDIEGSEETAGITYDWRTYASTYGTSKRKSKGKSKTYYGSKSEPEYTWRPKPTQADLDQANDFMADSAMDGFPSIGEFDGWSKSDHMGIKPNGATYDLPQWCQPDKFREDLVSLMRGDMRDMAVNNEWSYCPTDGWSYYNV